MIQVFLNVPTLAQQPHFWKFTSRTKFKKRYKKVICLRMGFRVAQLVKNLPANAGDAKDAGSISRSGRSPGEWMATHSCVLAWKIPWQRSLVGYSPWDHRVRHDWAHMSMQAEDVKSLYKNNWAILHFPQRITGYVMVHSLDRIFHRF